MIESPPIASATQSKSSQTSVDVLIEKLRSTLEQKVGSLSAGKGKLKDIFSRMDENGDGQISQRELYDRLSDLEADFTHAEVAQIFNKYDVDKSGAISYEVTLLYKSMASIDALSLTDCFGDFIKIIRNS